MVGNRMVPEIIQLADDKNVAALMLRVNSGGGSAFASEQIWEALEYFKSKNKPFYVSMGDMAASGGYYISCGANRIYADHTTLTGSIGVFGLIPDFSELTGKAWPCILYRAEKCQRNIPSLLTGLTLTGCKLCKARLKIPTICSHRVWPRGRGISQDSVKVIAEGRVWTGGCGFWPGGLVDEIGSLDAAVKVFTEIAAGILKPTKWYRTRVVEDKFFSQFHPWGQERTCDIRGTLDANGVRILARPSADNESIQAYAK